jgi:hypothetical protein
MMAGANQMTVFLHISKTAGSNFQFILENTFGLSIYRQTGRLRSR